ncbi:MAG: hypothetical protein AAF518_21235 [Spirochaetota bacterium]
MFCPREIEIISSNLNEDSFLEEEMSFIVEVFNLADIFSREVSLDFFDFESFVERRYEEHRKKFTPIFSVKNFFNDFWNECYLIASSTSTESRTELLQIYYHLN